MLSKAKLKYFTALHLKKYRDEEGLFLAEGKKLLEEGLGSYIYPETIIAQHPEELTEKYNLSPSVEILTASRADIERISQRDQGDGIILVYKKFTKNESFNPGPVFILDTIQDPGNLGTIIRIADWFGFSGIILSSECADLYNHKTIQASMGSLFRVKTRVEPDLPDFILKNVHTSIAAAVTSDAVFQINSSMTQYLIIGNEGRGIRNEILTIPGLRKIQIRGFGKAESLNASVAAGILAYQFMNSEQQF